jgi:hypothetical protein
MMTINYPDVLGYITGGVRQSFGALHGAVALRPHPVRAGRPFELVVLLQNAGNTPVDVSATVRLPEFDAKRQKGRFAVKGTHVTAQLLAGETGYIALPCLCHAETAPHEDPAEVLKGVSLALEARLPDLDENDAPIQEITDVLLERTAQKYGYKLSESQISYLTPFRCAQPPLSIWSGAKNRQVPGVRFALRRTRFALKVNFRDSLKLN